VVTMFAWHLLNSLGKCLHLARTNISPQHWVIFKVISQSKTEFQFLFPVPAKPEPEIGVHRIYGRNLPEFIFTKTYFIPKCVICILNKNVKYWKKYVSTFVCIQLWFWYLPEFHTSFPVPFRFRPDNRVPVVP
jgi:hypothetical protein